MEFITKFSKENYYIHVWDENGIDNDDGLKKKWKRQFLCTFMIEFLKLVRQAVITRPNVVILITYLFKFTILCYHITDVYIFLLN
jgi:hypothetical protein